jgi:hypothetical protein
VQRLFSAWPARQAGTRSALRPRAARTSTPLSAPRARPLGPVPKSVVVVIAVFAPAFTGVGTASAAVTYRSATYPAAFQFSGIAVSAQGLGLYGTATVAGDQGVDCLEAHVGPGTLALSDVFEPRCDDPRAYGEPVVPVEATVDRGNYISVRVARVDPTTGHIEVGPVLGTDEDASDTRPQWVYGSGWLWLYLAAPKGSPHAGEALRVSEATGQLVQEARVSPALYRPVIAADANGLYLSPAVNGGLAPGPGTENAAIFEVGTGATTGNVFYRWPSPQFNGFADWMSGYGDQLSADLCQHATSSLTCELANFNGTSNQPSLLVPEPDLDGWAVGNTTVGFFSSLMPANDQASSVLTTIVRIDPSTGTLHKVVSVPLPGYWGFLEPDGTTSAALYDGNLYLLGSSGTADEATLRPPPTRLLSPRQPGTVWQRRFPKPNRPTRRSHRDPRAKNRAPGRRYALRWPRWPWCCSRTGT